MAHVIARPTSTIPARSARRPFGRIVAAIRSVVAPASLTEAPTVADPADLVAAAELPSADEIEAAAAAYIVATDQARRADRVKRAARKVLDRLPAGLYGAWQVERAASSRQVADLDAIARIFKQHGLGPVPMKTVAPSLKVTRAVADTVTTADAPVLAAV